MKMLLVVLCLHLAMFPIFAQVTPPADDAPLPLDEVMEYVSVSKVDLERVIETIRVRGLGFELNETALSHILVASQRGKREPALTAKLILQMLQVCPDCRQRYFGQWTKDDLLALLVNKKLSPAVLLQEVQIRGVKDLPKTSESIARLRQAGATPELINLLVPEDEIPMAAPVGYEVVPVARSATYDRTLTSGTVSLIVKVTGTVEFVFLRNALFTKTTAVAKMNSRAEVTMINFTAPIPKTGGAPSFTLFSTLDRPPAKSKKVAEQPITLVDGGFKFTVNETDKDGRVYVMLIKYGTPPTPNK